VVSTREDVAAIGFSPVTASSPSNIAVTLDPEFAPVPGNVACEGAPPLMLCSYPPPVSFHPRAEGETVVVSLVYPGFLAGPELILELVPTTGVPVARTFLRHHEDFFPPDIPRSCEQALTPRIELSGTLIVNGVDAANPTDTHGRLVLDFPEGGRATIDF
jgi:hypothetical protein